VSPRFREGLRAGVPYGFAGALLAISFGVLARDVGMPAWAAILFSLLVFAGSAQFAALSVLGGGGGAAAAVIAVALMNSRFLPIATAFGPSLPGGPFRRAAQSQAVVDVSLIVARNPDGSFDRDLLLGSTAAQWVGWQTGTVAGALGGALIGDPEALGLDAMFPAFFLFLLIAELRRGRVASGVAAAGALIAFALVPVAPPGVPILAASLAALWGLRERKAAPA